MEDACEATLVGYVLAKSLWKLQRYWSRTAKERTQYTSSIEHIEGSRWMRQEWSFKIWYCLVRKVTD
ncbi:hypothetical protein Patl1_27767 [Pistacia atlantica]|uniref:Uncharacterized protein n=1 Tax=Pistacia atlantica TaxID=434234 RepID=A0ACC1BFM2_9ROSI|nr:hypothetical protein Patl1_27767 [Pistacia atlantica]